MKFRRGASSDSTPPPNSEPHPTALVEAPPEGPVPSGIDPSEGAPAPETPGTPEAVPAVPDAPVQGETPALVAPPRTIDAPVTASLVGAPPAGDPTREAEPLGGGEPSARAEHKGGPQHRRSRRPHRLVFAVLAVVVVLAGASAIVISDRLHAGEPRTTIMGSVATSGVVPGGPPTIAWPSGVQSAFSIPVLGVSADGEAQSEVPVASLTKLMTAHVVLGDHPLAPGEDGPTITIGESDVEQYEQDVATDQANIPVAVGEVLTERQLLEGMLIHSANNFADLLAIFDAGSVSAFVPKMNQAAAALGMHDTTYADASGYSPQSMSTPADQLKVATLDMADPVVAQIVEQTTVTLPVSGTVGSYTPLVGIDGVVGVKSGFTSAAGGCDVLALHTVVAGKPVTVLAAVVGYHDGVDVIAGAGLEALALARSVAGGIRRYQAVARGERVGTAGARGRSSAVVTISSDAVPAWPGERVVRSLVVSHDPRLGAPAGSSVGVLRVSLGTERLGVGVVTASDLPGLSLLERIF